MANDHIEEEKFCLKWHNHQSTFMSMLNSYMKREVLVDVTLAAEGKFIEAHKLVLCTCSKYFEKALSSHKENKQAFIFVSNVTYEDLKGLVEFMYSGEVNVSQEQLPRFMEAADALQIKGLTDASEIRDNPSCKESKTVSPKNKKARLAVPAKTDNLPSHPSQLLVPNHSPVPEVRRATVKRQSTPESADLSGESASLEDHFVAVDSVEEFQIERSESDGLGTLGKVWSMGQQNNSEWVKSRETASLASADHFATHLSESEMTDNSLDYHQYSTSLVNDDTISGGGANIDEFLPGPSTSAASEPLNRINWSSVNAASQALAGKFRITSNPTHKSNSSGSIVCPTCGRRYTQKGSLNRHLKLECGITPKFACEFCPMRFRRAYKLTEHVKRNHSKHGNR